MIIRDEGDRSTMAMNAYMKGGIVTIAIAIGIFIWYRTNVGELAVNRSPKDFQLISEMEKSGAPDFSLSRFSGTGEARLSDLRGKVVIVNFWASWCNPCVEEFPSMIKLVESLGGDVIVLAVSTDDEEKDIHAFMKAFGLPRPGFEVLWDKNKSVMNTYGVNKIPESFLIGRDGKLVRKVLGIENWASPDAIDYFKQLLK